MEEIYPAAVKAMLQLHFINVGDGDAILAEDQQDGRTFRLLIDAGNRDVEPSPDSCRLTAGEYLRSRGIHRVDALVVTHLHSDHFAGLENMTDEVRFDAVWSGFFPPAPGLRAEAEALAPKTVRGLVECLNRWSALTETLSGRGTELRPVWESAEGIRLTQGLQMDLVCPDPTLCAVQRQIFASVLAGERVPGGMVYWASKFRNPGSLRVRLTYAGRRVELPGDCYGSMWEGDAAPCDIFKAPHHGDIKALTEPLVRRLRPAWTVISCAEGYIPKKDRPSARTLELLRGVGSRVWFTDCFTAPGQACDHWPSVDFTITEDGSVLTPDSRQERREAGAI